VPIEAEATVVLNNVFFDFDKAVLKPESFPELNRVVELMNERTSLAIEISGHTDATGPESYNMGLSRRRAEAVYNYLVEKGISTDRLDVKYFGENQPVETNETIAGRRANRRVEFKITND
jgi:outer membrane protein OmpA-like peptidoglycan-associated protein